MTVLFNYLFINIRSITKLILLHFFISFLHILSGTLDVPDGTTLRTHLSCILNCDPMRITKKFTGDSCIGKRIFQPLCIAEENESRDESSKDNDNDNNNISNDNGNDNDNKIFSLISPASSASTNYNNIDNKDRDNNNLIGECNLNKVTPISTAKQIENETIKLQNELNKKKLIEISRRELKILRKIWLEKMLGTERETARKNCVRSSSAVKHSSGRNKVRTLEVPKNEFSFSQFVFSLSLPLSLSTSPFFLLSIYLYLYLSLSLYQSINHVFSPPTFFSFFFSFIFSFFFFFTFFFSFFRRL